MSMSSSSPSPSDVTTNGSDDMSYVPDLAPSRFGAFSLLDVSAVGWLSSEHAHTTGPVPPLLVDRLRELSDAVQEHRCAVHPPGTILGPVATAGVHECEFCPADGRRYTDGGELYVARSPSGGFEAPTMIVHYIEQHSYQPPAAFITAVLAAPSVEDLISSMNSAAMEVLRLVD
jgi:hypothetical protein